MLFMLVMYKDASSRGRGDAHGRGAGDAIRQGGGTFHAASELGKVYEWLTRDMSSAPGAGECAASGLPVFLGQPVDLTKDEAVLGDRTRHFRCEMPPDASALQDALTVVFTPGDKENAKRGLWRVVKGRGMRRWRRHRRTCRKTPMT